MKIKKSLVIAAFLILALAITALSQISNNDKFEKYKVNKVNDKITLEEKQDCTTVYYNETVSVYGNVTKTRDTYGTCFNEANSSYYQCVNGTEQYPSYEVVNQIIQRKSKDDCESKNSFIVSVNRNNEVIKKEVD